MWPHFPGWRTTRCQRGGAEPVIFKQRHTLASSRVASTQGVLANWTLPGTVQAERPPPLPATRAPQALFVTAPGRDRVIHSHTSPPKTFMFSELAGRRRKLGAPCPLRGAYRPPRRVRRPGIPARAAHPEPLAVTRPPAPDSLRAPILASQSHPARGGGAERDARPGRLRRGHGGSPGAGIPTSAAGARRTPNPGLGGCTTRARVGVGGGGAGGVGGGR